MRSSYLTTVLTIEGLLPRLPGPMEPPVADPHEQTVMLLSATSARRTIKDLDYAAHYDRSAIGLRALAKQSI